MGPAASTGLTRTGYRFVAVITGLSVAHHVDHVLRDVTGWPFAGGFNAFSASLFVYPVIVAGIVMSRRRKVGPRFWVTLAGGAAAFLVAVHVGPAAGDAVQDISDAYAAPAGAVVALLVLGALIFALVAHAVYELAALRQRLPAQGDAGP